MRDGTVIGWGKGRDEAKTVCCTISHSTFVEAYLLYSIERTCTIFFWPPSSIGLIL